MGTHLLTEGSRTAEIWTPFARRCSPLRAKLMSSTLPSPNSKEKLRRLTHNQTNTKLIRYLGKKIQGYECEFDETNDKLTKAMTNHEEREKALKNAEEEVSALTRRIMLMEEEAKKADSSLA